MPDWTRVRTILHKNDFFTVTSLTGWSFVAAAKTGKEVLFWYFVILTLVGLTIYQVQDLLVFYAAQDIKHEVVLRSSTDDIEILNMTLTVTVPLLDLYNKLPSKLSHDFCEKYVAHPETHDNGFPVLYDYFCIHNLDTLDEFSYLYRIIRDDFILAPKEMYYSNPLEELIKFNGHSKPIQLSDPAMLQNWKKELSKAKQELHQFFMDVKSTPQIHQDRCLIMSHIKELSNRPLSKLPNDTLTKLLVLQAMNTGLDPRSNYLVSSEPETAKQILDKMAVSPAEFYWDALADLSRFWHISIEPNASIEMRDWSWSLPMASETLYIDTNIWQSLSFALTVPRGVKELEIKFYSYVSMWLKHLISAWIELFEQYVKDEQTEFISCIAFVGGPFEILRQFLAYYSEVSSLSIELANGEGTTLSMVHEQRVSQIPNLSLKSKIKTCVEGYTETCIEECLWKSALEQCSCVPWGMSPAQSDPVCGEPCNLAKDQCQSECGRKHSQSCSLLLAQMGHSTGSFLDLPETLEMARVLISIPQMYNYIQATADFAMPFTSFLSLLGGSIEIWGVCTLPALLHLCVYFLIKCFSNCCKCKQQIDEDDDMELLSNVLADVQILKESIDKHLQKPVWWHWFKGNSFYEETPMIGYAYISAAASTIEKLFWYLVIAVFASLGIYNLYSTVVHFSSRSTYHNIFPTVYTESLGIPNFTMKLHLPLFELNSKGFFDRSLLYNPKIVQPLLTLHTMIAELENWLKNDKEHHSKPLIDYFNEQLLAQPWHEIILNYTNAKQGVLNFFMNEPGTIDQWQNLMDSSMSRLKNVTEKEGPIEIQTKIPQLVEAPLKYGDRNQLVFKLILLHAIKHGNAAGIQYLNIGAIDANLMKEINWQLFQSTISNLGKIFYIDVPENTTVTPSDLFINYAADFVIQMDVKVPLGLDHFEVKIHSLMKLWADRIIRHVVHRDDITYDSSYLDLVSYLHGEIFSHYLLRWYREIPRAEITMPEAQHGVTVSFDSAQQHISVTKKWQLVSTGNRCFKQSYGSCFDECMRKTYFKICNCIPWHSVHVSATNLCQKPCSVNDESVCSAQCQNNICEKQMVKLGEVVHSYEHDDELIQFELYAKQELHTTLVEHYDLTTGKFVAEVGGLLEFWVGLNIFALVHAFIYAIKWCLKHRRKPVTEDREKANSIRFLKRKRKEIVELMNRSRELTIKLNKTNKISTEPKRKRRFGWLHKNLLFTETPMTGFSFIATSKTYCEVVFWHLCITIFFIITIFNIESGVELYRSKPTKITAAFIHDGVLPTGNLTLRMHAPLTELATKVLIAEREISPITYATTAADFLLCSLRYNDAATFGSANDKSIEEWLEFEKNWNIDQTLQPSLNKDISNERNLQQWNDKFDEAASKLLDFLAINGQTVLNSNSSDVMS